MKLTQDQKEAIDDMVQSGQWQAVLSLCDVVIKRQQDALLRFDLAQPARDMVLLKARIEGAEGLRGALANVKKAIKET